MLSRRVPKWYLSVNYKNGLF